MAIYHESPIRRVTLGPRYDGPARAAGVAIAAATALVLGLLILKGPLLALAAAACFTLAVGAVAAPRGFRVAAYVALGALPFISALTLFRPGQHDYSVYFAACALALVGLGAFQPRMFAAGSGTLFLSYLSIAATVAIIFRGGAGGVRDLAFILAAFAMYTLVRRADADERRLLVVLIIGFAVVQSVLAVAQSVTGWPVFPAVLPELLRSERNYFSYFIPGLSQLVTQGSGTFAHFNALGAVLSACLPLAFGVWLVRRRSPWRLIAFTLTAAGVVATFSRGALFGAVAGALFVLWLGPARSRRATVALVACVGILASLLGLNVAAQYYTTTQNLNIRAQTWQLALNDALEKPSNLVVGFGYEHFQRDVLGAGIGSKSITPETQYMASLHSGHLQLLLEFGVLGAALFAIWLVSAFRGVRSAAASPLVVAALGGALGLLISQTLDNALFSYGGVILAVLIAISEGELQDSREIPNQATTSKTGRSA